MVIIKKSTSRTSLVAQWLRICLPMQGTRVQALVREDPTCRGATKPVRRNYLAWALEPVSHNYWAHEPQLLKPAPLEPVLRNKRSHRNEKPAHHTKSSPRSPRLEKARTQQRRPNAAKNKINLKKKSTNNKCWRWCGEKRTLLHCWWECQLVQPL